jgi:Putative Flp pilus-assembly TadE/G-like
MSALLKAMMARLGRDERGATAVVTAFALLVLMGFAGLAIDVILWELDGRKIQTAADEAALAGAIALSANDNVTSAVDTVAASFGFVTGKNGTSISINQDYHNLKEVEVTISQLQPQYFTRMFLPAPTVSKAAVAQPPGRPSNGNMCVMALDQSGKLSVGSVTLNGTTDVELNQCDLYNDSGASDSTDLEGTTTLSARHIILSGGYYLGNNASMTPNPPTATYAIPVPDPYNNDRYKASLPTYAGCNQTNFTVSSGQTRSESGGVYCGGITVEGGGTLNLSPGTYIIDGGNFEIQGNGTVNGTGGVTIVLTSSTASNYGIVHLHGGSIVNLTAPTAGASAGIPGMAIWVDGNAPNNNDTINGGASNVINGAIYMPSQVLYYAGGAVNAVGTMPATFCIQLVAFTITFDGNSYLTHSGCSAADLPVQDPLAPPHLAL